MVGKLTPDNVLSASRAAQLEQLSPYGTVNELLAEMIAVDEGKPQTNFEGNELTHWGNIHEPHILVEASLRLGLSSVNTQIDVPYFHPSLPLAASLDGDGIMGGPIQADTDKGIYLINTDGIDAPDEALIIEAKSTQSMPEDVPPPWRGPIQLQAQMMCRGANYGAVAVLYRGSTLRVFVYEADLAIQKRIAESVLEFERRRAAKEFYPVLTSNDGNVAYPEADEKAPPLDIGDSTVQDAVQALLAAKQAKKQAEQTIDESQAIIKQFMGNHEQAVADIGGKKIMVKWGMRNMRATPEKTVPAKAAQRVRSNTLTVREINE